MTWGAGSDLAVPQALFGEILSSAADIVIALDRVGIIQNIFVNPNDQALGCLDHWVGRDIRDFVTPECQEKIENAFADLAAGFVKRLRSIEINHVDNANWEFPIRYSMIDAGPDVPILMLGRDLGPVAEIQQKLVKAQMALEKDYEAYREFNTRYRVVMAATRDAFALIDARSGRIEDINVPAALVLGSDPESLIGGSFFQEFEDRRRTEFLDVLNAAASMENVAPIVARTRRGRLTVKLYPSVFRAAGQLVLLCRMEAEEVAEPLAEELGHNLRALFNKGFEAMVFTDARGGIQSANESFLNLCDVAGPSGLVGKSLADFLVRGGVDLKILIDGATRAGRMRLYATKLETAFGAQRPVEVSATWINGRADPGFAFVLRDMSRIETAPAVMAPANGDVARNVMELVGATPLKDIVAATTDVVEKMCIETAVELTRNNRVAAAEMLGLSRQSLYVKLRKYNLLSRSGEE